MSLPINENNVIRAFNDAGMTDAKIIQDLIEIKDNAVIGNPGSKNRDMMEDRKTKLKVIELIMKAKQMLKWTPVIQVINAFQKSEDTQLY